MSHRYFQRYPSLILISDDEDDDNHRKNFMDTQFSTPMSIETNKTNDLQLMLPLSTPPRSTLRKDTTMATSERKETELIDFITPDKSINNIYQSNYKPRTLHFHNQQRLSILPTYPIMDMNYSSNLLLLNISPTQLSQQELLRRQTGTYKPLFSITNSNTSTISFMVKQYNTYFVPTLDHLKVDLSILDHNYTRLLHVIELSRLARFRTIGSNKQSYEIELNLKENE
ncbi:unnamed protein product [Rotaria sp. Silwood2]|nr:unnamed protein product [Rotaria sp. Silwood2]CAF3073407.1 unnamed protein product [Rotaria sp. Silwood2]CAF3396326.1 unnamed protein product [Rotaria sp. Silwood2]CAF4213370.1 unnamed protein product [Rotaria sp. Silwood2]CAF4335370.1 unnamed protein product [Rotaria sp. Silwood2]